MTHKSRLPLLTCLFVLFLLAGLVTRLYAYPQPAPFPISWEFDLSHGKPTPISVRGPDGLYHWYWYMTYKVVNNTGEERLFIPEVAIATDQGDVTTAGKNVPPIVFSAIKAKVGNRLLLSPTQVVGTLLQGKDYAKESVIIWPDFGHDIDQLNIMIAGLSGEQVTEVEVPATQPSSQSASQPASTPHVFRKTLMITYNMPGTTKPGPDTIVIFHGDSWIMR